MKFKLPALHHLVNQNKKASNDSASKYIHVLKGHAFINHEIVAVVNLRDYIKSECRIEEEADIEELDMILEWLEGKSFTSEFWSNLTKEQLVSPSDDSLMITDSSYTNYLHYQSVELDLRQPMKSIADNIDIVDANLFRVSFNGSHLALLTKAFGSEIKRDYLNFEFSETGKPVKFSFSARNYIFGCIKSTMNSASELLAFIGNRDFAEILTTQLSSLPELPPEAVQEETPLFGGDDEELKTVGDILDEEFPQSAPLPFDVDDDDDPFRDEEE